MSLRYPFSSHPRGWFVIGRSSELAVGDVRPLQRFGKELVLVRTADGVARMFDAYCPHLGTHLGYGGRVEGNELICHAHGRRYDAQGDCVAVPSCPRALPQPGLRAWPVAEYHGLLVAHHHDGSQVEWSLPALPWTPEEWTPIQHGHQGRSRANVWEMAADVCDVDHFRLVHGHQDATFTAIDEDGPLLHCTLEFVPRTAAFGRRAPTSRAAVVRQTLAGLGIQTFHSRVDLGGGIQVETMLISASTPIDEDHVDSRWALSVKRLPNDDVTRMIEASFRAGVVQGYQDDHEIHASRAYLARPALAPGDAAIGRFRRWSRQFYDDVLPFRRDAEAIIRQGARPPAAPDKVATQVVNEVDVEVPALDVQALLADAVAFLRLNPTVMSVARDADDASRFHVVNEIDLASRRARIAVTVQHRAVDQGITTESWSPAGVHLVSTWEVIPRGPTAKIRESTRVEAPALLLAEAADSSRQMHQALLRALKSRVESQLPAPTRAES